MKRFLPDYMSDSIYEIDYDTLYDKGIRALLFDIDNTVLEMFSDHVSETAMSLFKTLGKKGFSVCIISNAGKVRTAYIARSLGVKYIKGALKPFKYGFLKAARIMNVEAVECAVIGDQLFTDIVGGNKAKMTTILIKPISSDEIFYIGLKRIFERKILKKHERNIKRI